ANALGCECPPAPACGGCLLLYFAPKGIRPRHSTCAAVKSDKQGLAFPASLRSTARRACRPSGRHEAAQVGSRPDGLDLRLVEEASTTNRQGGVPAGVCGKQAMDGLRRLVR